MDKRDNALVIASVAARLGVPAEWLDALVKHESGYNPLIKNPSPKSSARGLIQFIDSTAKGMGYEGGSQELIDQHPTFESQMQGPVYQYLKVYAPYKTLHQFVMAVFLPSYMKKPPTERLPQNVINANAGSGLIYGGDYAAQIEKMIAGGKLLVQVYKNDIDQAVASGTLPKAPAYVAPIVRKTGSFIAALAIIGGATLLYHHYS